MVSPRPIDTVVGAGLLLLLHHRADISGAWDTDGKLEPSHHNTIEGGGLLRESYFPQWQNGASQGGLENAEEMQKQDPLATQIWKLYSRTKSQLPNQQRMENLTWRMMAMSLRRKEREQAHNRYVVLISHGRAWVVSARR